MSITMPSTGTVTQTVKIYTDVERAHTSIICPITATLSPSAAYIILSADYTTITITKSLIVLPSEIGTNVFTLTVNSLNFAANVTQKTYTFNVIITCTVSSLAITS